MTATAIQPAQSPPSTKLQVANADDDCMMTATPCGRHQYGAPLRPWRYELLRISAVRTSRLRIRDRMN
eukprot:955920-Pleurochrysis_carterae.AAC.1